jgi:hypothetical protein
MRRQLRLKHGTFVPFGAHIRVHTAPAVALLVEWKMPQCVVIFFFCSPNQPDGLSSRNPEKEIVSL